MHTALRPVLKLLEDIGTPRSLCVSLLIRHNEWAQVAQLKCDPRLYLTAESFRKDYVATDILRKCADLPTGIDTHSASVQKWFEAEKQCLKTNLRLEPYLRNAEGSELVYRVISHMRRFIKQVLGPTPPLAPFYSLDQTILQHGLEGRFGPGATYSDIGLLTTVADKMSSKPTWTPQAWEECKEAFSLTAWARALPEYRREPILVHEDRFVSVPKDATTNRGISIQPGGNVFFQLAYGRYMRERLKTVCSWDLTVAQQTHKRVAREGSLSGLVATIDLTSASDTVSRALVELSLPIEWFQRLAALRTTHTRFSHRDLKGTSTENIKRQASLVYLEKFSAMGNGYTFELETLLFASIVHGVLVECGFDRPRLGRDYYVYGDDIIVPSQYSSNVIAALRFFGFSPNPRKTFVDGEFRESCGGDYFAGKDVRPVHIENLPKEPHEYIALANSLRRLSPFGPNAPIRGHWTERAWRATLDFLPSHIRACTGPAGLGDIVIHDVPETWQIRPATYTSWEPTGPHRNRKRHWKGRREFRGYFEIKCWKVLRDLTIPWTHFTPDVILACALYRYGDGLTGITPRKPISSYGTAWTACPS